MCYVSRTLYRVTPELKMCLSLGSLFPHSTVHGCCLVSNNSPICALLSMLMRSLPRAFENDLSMVPLCTGPVRARFTHSDGKSISRTFEVHRSVKVMRERLECHQQLVSGTRPDGGDQYRSRGDGRRPDRDVMIEQDEHPNRDQEHHESRHCLVHLLASEEHYPPPCTEP